MTRQAIVSQSHGSVISMQTNIIYDQEGTKFADFPVKRVPHHPLNIAEPFMNHHPEFDSNSSKPRMSLETMISVGVFGWLALGMVLMGLGIW